MDIKTAIKTVKKHCENKENCKGCQFNGRPQKADSYHCKLDSTPKHWNVRDID